MCIRDRLGAPLPKPRVLSEREVERMLDETPVVEYDARSETAEFESLDEDREFYSDRDFASCLLYTSRCV